jgi:hypothetical protein
MGRQGREEQLWEDQWCQVRCGELNGRGLSGIGGWSAGVTRVVRVVEG